MIIHKEEGYIYKKVNTSDANLTCTCKLHQIFRPLCLHWSQKTIYFLKGHVPLYVSTNVAVEVSFFIGNCHV